MLINIRKANQKDAVFIVKMNKALALETESLTLDDQVISLGVANCLKDSAKVLTFLRNTKAQSLGN